MPPKKRKSAPSDATQHEINVLWVTNHFTSDEPLKVKAMDAPSTEAWALLQVYNQDAKSQKDFLDRFYRPLYVKDKQQSGEQARADDQRKFFQLFSLLESERPNLLNENFPKSTPAQVPEERITPEAATAASAAEGVRVVPGDGGGVTNGSAEPRDTRLQDILSDESIKFLGDKIDEAIVQQFAGEPDPEYDALEAARQAADREAEVPA